MKHHTISVIIPAHNEEKYIGKCIRSVRNAEKKVYPNRVEIIVVANRCTDNTERIAKKLGAAVLHNSDKCIASVRNTGVRASHGDIIVTIDADSRMIPNCLQTVVQMLDSGKYIGGGTISKFDRMSIGIFCSAIYVAFNCLPKMIRSGAFLSGGMFWLFKADFDRIGGFDEKMVSVEDLDFAKRLKTLGDQRRKKYGTLKNSYIFTSSRKFDEFGDWYLIKNHRLTKEIFTGKNQKAADAFYYDVR